MIGNTNDIYTSRAGQAFPRFTNEEMARLTRFRDPRQYRAGDVFASAGAIAEGMLLIVSGEVEVTRDVQGTSEHVVTHGPGSFAGELAQLSGRPSLVDVRAIADVEARSFAQSGGDGRGAGSGDEPFRAADPRADG